MSEPPIYLPPFPTPAKPRRDEPCNGCGWCCHLEVCAIGKSIFPEAVAPCPAIIYEGGMVRCGFVLGELPMIEKDAKTEPLVQTMLGIGQGCCADDPV